MGVRDLVEPSLGKLTVFLFHDEGFGGFTRVVFDKQIPVMPDNFVDFETEANEPAVPVIDFAWSANDGHAIVTEMHDFGFAVFVAKIQGAIETAIAGEAVDSAERR